MGFLPQRTGHGVGMHVGLVIYGALNGRSGGYRYDREIVRYLRARGDTVTVFSLPEVRYRRSLLHNLSADFRERLAAASVDVLLQDELNHPSLCWMNRRLQSRVSYPIVTIVHNLRSCLPVRWWKQKGYSCVERLYLKSVDACIYNSPATRHAVERLREEECPSVTALPSGRRFERHLPGRDIIHARAHEEGPLRLIFVGNVRPVKGLPTLIGALAQLPEAEWQLAVAGSLTADADHSRKVKEQVRRHGLMDHIHFHGFLKERELARQLSKAHVMVLPSQYEGYGMALVEAMGFGLPVIASTAGAGPEIVADGADGFLIAPHDEDALAARIRLLHAQRDRLADMGAAARDAYDRSPTWEDTGSIVRNFLTRLTAS